MLEMGEIEQNLAKQAARAKAPLPDRIANAPVLHQGLELYLDAFFDLDSDRQVGQALLPIPWSSVIRFAEVYELDNEQRDDLLFFIRCMDNAHIDRVNKKNARK